MMLPGAMPPILTCPFCERAVEAVTLQRDPEDTDICIVMYFHPDGEKHFVTYRPAALIHGEVC